MGIINTKSDNDYQRGGERRDFKILQMFHCVVCQQEFWINSFFSHICVLVFFFLLFLFYLPGLHSES